MIDIHAFLTGIKIGIVITLLLTFPYGALFLIWLSAKYNVWFTIIEEGRARAIMVNNKFTRFVMSYENALFYGDLGKKGKKQYKKERYERGIDWEPSRWDVYFDVPEKVKQEAKEYEEEAREKRRKIEQRNAVIRFALNSARKIKSLRHISKYIEGLYWVGIPPLATVHKTRFRWSSIEEISDPGTGESKKVLRTQEDPNMDFIEMKIDIFPITEKSAETGHMMPVDVLIAVTMRVENPYKAWFDAEKWMEVMENQLGPKIRKLLGRSEYDEIIKSRLPEKKEVGDKQYIAATEREHGEESLLSDSNLEGILKYIRRVFGLHIMRVQIIRIDPSVDLKEMFIKASTLVYVANEQAKAHKIEGKGLADRDKTWLEAVSKIEGGQQMFTARELSKVEVLSLGGGKDIANAIVVKDVAGGKNKKTGETEEKEVGR